MARNAPLASVQPPGATGARLTRSASTLSKQVEPSSPADLEAAHHGDDDGDLEDNGAGSDENSADDDIAHEGMPSQGSGLSSQTRQQLARAGSSALQERESEMDHDEERSYSSASEDEDARSLSRDSEEDIAMDRQDEEGEGDDAVEESSESEQEDPRSEGELQSIRYEMQSIEDAVPKLADKYQLLDRLGEGAFRLARFTGFAGRGRPLTDSPNGANGLQALSRVSTKRSTFSTICSTTRSGGLSLGKARSTSPSSGSTSPAVP